MKKVMVISHERSGTSFLINAIGMNFPDYLPEADAEGTLQRVDLDGNGWNFADPDEMLKFLSDSRFHDMPIANVFKSHHTRHYFDEVWDYLQEQFHVFYIYRDGRDVMASYWRHVRKQGFLWGPMAFTVGEFMRADPVGACCRYLGPMPPGNMVQRWNDHVMSWLKYNLPGVCRISYEQLSENFDTMIEKISVHLEVAPPENIIQPGVGGVHPGKGIVGGWRDHFIDGDSSFFDDQARVATELIRNVDHAELSGVVNV